MVCKKVWHGAVGTNVSAGGRVLLQVESGEDEAFQQARASLTIEQAESLILDLRQRISQAKGSDSR